MHLAQSITEFATNPHLTGGKMKPQEGKWFAQGHTGIMQKKQNQNSDFWIHSSLTFPLHTFEQFQLFSSSF